MKRIVTYSYKVGDVLEAQGARLTVIGLTMTPQGGPAYEMVSAFTTGDPWLVEESFLLGCRVIRKRKTKK